MGITCREGWCKASANDLCGCDGNVVKGITPVFNSRWDMHLEAEGRF